MDPRMLAVGGNIIGSFLLGQQQREARLEDQKFKQQQLKMMMEAQKIKDAKEERAALAEERKSAIRQQMIQLELGKSLGASPESGGVSGGSGLNFGETFGKDSTAAQTTQNQPSPKKLIDILSENPLLAIALKEETGTDYPAAVEARRKAQADEETRRNNFINMLARAGAGTWVPDVVTDGPNKGATRQVFRITNPTLAHAVLNGGAGMQMPGNGLGATPPMLGGGGSGGFSSLPTPYNRKEIVDGQTVETPSNPYTGEPMPGAKPAVVQEKQPLSGEAAGRAGMVNSSLDSLMAAKNILMPNGKLREDKILGVPAWKAISGVGAIPGVNALLPEAREFESHMKNALAAKLRLETGANMPATEISNLNDRFKPSPLDSDKLVKSKLESMERFLRGSIEMFDPNKKYTSDTIIVKDEQGRKYAWQAAMPKEKDAKLEGILFGK